MPDARRLSEQCVQCQVTGRPVPGQRGKAAEFGWP